MPLRSLAILLAWSLAAVASDRVAPLAGTWRFRLDPGDAGIREEWFKSDLPGRIPLPGSTDEHRQGNPNDRREPRRLTRAYEYVGAAWYQRDVDIPPEWKGRRITLFLERCHWESQAWLDDRYIGLQNSLSTPHVHDLGSAVMPGRRRLTLRVDNTLKVDLGWWASAVTEEGPSNWNGVIGRMELRASDPVWIDWVAVYPGLARQSARVHAKVRNTTGAGQAGELILTAGVRGGLGETFESRSRVAISALPETALQVEVMLGAAPALWDDTDPKVYDLTVSLASAAFSDELRTAFGMREFTRRGARFELNRRAIVLRGTVDNGAFPLAGHPPMDVEAWRRRFQVYRQYGFNHVRFHSWCPPEAAFTAADELGVILQVENPMWIGDGRISANALRTAFIRQEAESIVDTYGNHPSFCLMSMGNELGTGLDPFLGALVRSLRARDARHLYTSTTAPDNPLRPDDYFVSAGPRWQNLRGDPRLEQSPPGTDFDYRDYVAGGDRPVIAHELGQWTVFPNLAEVAGYTGALRPRYFELYRESLERRDLLAQTEEFRRASGALMLALYKEEIESVLRTPGLAGFQLLGLSDWPGFGPAFIGALDALNEPKGLIAPDAFRRFNSDTAPLLRIKKRVWATGEIFTGRVETAQSGPAALASATWAVRDAEGRTLASGPLAAGNEIRLPLAGLPAPARYSIEVTVGAHANDWNIWVYPERLPADPAGVLVATGWDGAARAALEQGRTVALWLAPGTKANTVPASFTSVFWSLLWFPKRPETMGLVCDPAHPALARFPTAFHSDWQWWDLTSRSRAFVLNDAPPGLRPIVQMIDDVNRNYRLGAVIEARAAKGKLLAASLDLQTSLESRLAARQLRHSLLHYAASARFDPPVRVDLAFLDKLFVY